MKKPFNVLSIITICMVVSVASLNIMCFDDGGSSGGDPTAPTVSSVVPEDGAINISTGTNFVVTFDVSMATNSVTVNFSDTTCSGAIQLSTTASNFTTCIQMEDAPSIGGSDKIYSFSPAATLSDSTEYKLKITTAVTDGPGTPLAEEVIITFSTM